MTEMNLLQTTLWKAALPVVLLEPFLCFEGVFSRRPGEGEESLVLLRHSDTEGKNNGIL